MERSQSCRRLCTYVKFAYCSAVTRGHMITGQHGRPDDGYCDVLSRDAWTTPSQPHHWVRFGLLSMPSGSCCFELRPFPCPFAFKHWRGSNCLVYPLDDPTSSNTSTKFCNLGDIRFNKRKLALDESRTYALRLTGIKDAGILIAMPSYSSLVMASLGTKTSLMLGETLLYGIGATWSSVGMCRSYPKVIACFYIDPFIILESPRHHWAIDYSEKGHMKTSRIVHFCRKWQVPPQDAECSLSIAAQTQLASGTRLLERELSRKFTTFCKVHIRVGLGWA